MFNFNTMRLRYYDGDIYIVHKHNKAIAGGRTVRLCNILEDIAHNGTRS